MYIQSLFIQYLYVTYNQNHINEILRTNKEIVRYLNKIHQIWRCQSAKQKHLNGCHKQNYWIWKDYETNHRYNYFLSNSLKIKVVSIKRIRSSYKDQE